MRRLIPRAALALLVVVAVSAPPANAAETGTLRGKVINVSTGRPQPGVVLELLTGSETEGGRVLERVRSDRRGRYVFTDLETGEDRFYALDARFQGGLFAGRPITVPSDTARPPVISSTMRVWSTTSEPDVVEIQRDDMFVVANSDGLGVIESVTLINSSDKAYIGRGRSMIGDEATGASFAFSIPSAAQGINVFDSTLDIPELVAVDRGFAATAAIPPGRTQVTFSYQLPGTGGTFDVSRVALYRTVETSIYAAAPLEVRSNRLVARGSIELEGKRYRRWTSEEPLEAGDPLQAIAVAQGQVPVRLFALIGGGIAIVLTAAGIAIRRRGKRRDALTDSGADRARLLEEVARLDLDLEADRIDRREWDARRAGLLAKLRETKDARA